MSRRQRRHAARHYEEPAPPASTVLRNGRVQISGTVPGLGHELLRGYYARQARRYQQAREAVEAEQEAPGG